MEPITVAQFVFSVASAANGLLEGQSTRAWRDEASGKLDQIIDQNREILETLKDVIKSFPKELDEFYGRVVSVEGKSLCNAFDQYMAPALPDIEQISQLRQKAEVLAYNLYEHGPCVYQSANAITWLSVAIHKILGVDRVQTENLVTSALDAMDGWIANTISPRITELTQTVAEKRTLLANEPRGSQVVIYSKEIDDGVGRERVLSVSSGSVVTPASTVLYVVADIHIDDESLTFSVTNARSTVAFNTWLNDDTVNKAAANHRAAIQARIDGLKSVTPVLDSLSEHGEALQMMLGELRNWE